MMKKLKIFGRHLKIREVPVKLVGFSRIALSSFLVFKFPIPVLRAYVARGNLESQMVPLRNGGCFFLSGHSEDVVTMVINLCGGEYGRIEFGDTVLDIGANIGAFSLFAARNGAKKIVSVEPNSQAFVTLRKNIEFGGFSRNVHLEHFAVGAAEGDTIYIPKESSPLNSQKSEPGDEFEAVPTVSIKSLIEKHRLHQIDVMKIDCEGAEYDALYSCTPEVFEIIKSIRVEIHPRRNQSRRDLECFIVSQGFKVQRRRGLVTWFAK
jgi:FkbM family methyltransferase